MTDPRLIRATQHANTIQTLARQLDTAIHLAANDGYDTVVKVIGAPIGNGRFLGTREDRVKIEATATFDVGKAVR